MPVDDRTRSQILSFDLPNPMKGKPGTLVDYEICIGTGELQEALRAINREGYTFLGATQHGDVYTIFFRRPAV